MPAEPDGRIRFVRPCKRACLRGRPSGSSLLLWGGRSGRMLSDASIVGLRGCTRRRALGRRFRGFYLCWRFGRGFVIAKTSAGYHHGKADDSQRRRV